ncbi:MAG: uncharacterized protein JWO22_1016 [Frankiales bacterium]|nr:uncharacterized protein [Frankiales bacterium]
MSGGALLTKGARARRLHLQVGHKLNGQLHGEHLGYHHGAGSDLAEVRPYQPGDDVRRFDWAVLARTGEPHVRTTVPERELETTLLLDLTPSMGFGTRVQDKRELALTMASAFAHLASGAGDRLGAVVLSKDGVRRFPPRATRKAAPHLLSVLGDLDLGEGQAPSLDAGLEAIPRQRRGVVVIVSDLLGPTSWERPLRRLCQRHDVVVVQVFDPRERELPHVGMLRVVDPETGRVLDVPTGSKAVRTRYAAAAAARQSELEASVKGTGAGHLVVGTDGDWLRELTQYLQLRRRIRAARRVASP